MIPRRPALITPFLLAIALIGATAPAAAAATRAEALFRFGATGSGAGQLSFPRATAADPHTGHVFVADGGNHRIDEFTPWGQFVKAFGWDVAPGAVNETQEVRVRAAHGAFRLGFEGKSTGDITFDAPAATVEAQLDGLESIGGLSPTPGSVSVSAVPGSADGAIPHIYLVAFKGSLAGANVQQLTIEDGAEALSGGDPSTEAEVRTRAEGTPAGTGLEDCTSESGCQAGKEGPRAGQISPSSLAVDGAGDLFVFESTQNINLPLFSTRVSEFSPSGRFVRLWGGDTIVDGAAGSGIVTNGSTQVTSVATTEKVFRVGQAIEGTGIEPGTTIEAVGAGTITLSAPAGPAATGTTTALAVQPGPHNVPANETQTVKLGANTTGGSFALGFETPNPSPSKATATEIPWNATALELQGKLEGLVNIGPAGGEVAVTGSTGGPWTVEFKGARFAGSDVEQLSANPSGLTVSTGERQATVTSANAAEICEAPAECQAGSRGAGQGQFTGAPSAIALAPGGGALYAADGERIQEFDPANGHYLGSLPDPEEVRKGKVIRSLAVNSRTGDLYLAFASGRILGEPQAEESVYELDPASGKLVGKIAIEIPTELAAGAEGHLYVVDERSSARPDHVVEFDEAGNQLTPQKAEEEECEKEEEGSQALCESLGIQPAGDLGTGPAGDLFVTNGSSVQAYGPPPLGLEGPPPAAPAIDAQYAVSVDTEGATLRAQVNPRFWSGALGTTRYYVQYGTAACVEAEGWEGPCVKERPSPPGSKLGGGAVSEDVGATVLLEGLSPATEYRYRFVAEGTGAPGEPVFGVGGTEAEEGAEASFRTFSSATEPEACANKAFRTGASAALPDCRAYEMVSPVDKGGGGIVVLHDGYTFAPATLDQSSEDGNRLAYGSYKAFGGAPSGAYTSQYIAARGPGGWSSHAISPPRTRPLASVAQLLDTELKLFSPDLCQAWVETTAEPPLAAQAVPGYFNLYRRTDEECGGPGYEAITTTAPRAEVNNTLELQGVAAGGAEAIYAASGQRSADAPTLSGESEEQLYWQGAGEGQPRFLCYLPDGKAARSACSAGGPPGEFWGSSRTAQVQNAISTDGERVFWSASAEREAAPIYLREHPSQAQSALALGSGEGKGKLTSGSPTVTSVSASEGEFAAGQRIAAPGIPFATTITAVEAGKLTLSAAAEKTKANTPLSAWSECSEPEAACTIAVSEEAEALTGSKGSRYWTAAADGSRAIFESGGNLYEFDVGTRETQLIAQGAIGVLGASQNATRVYFASSEVLTGEPNAEGRSPAHGEPNLYLYDEGKSGPERFAFIGTLAAADTELEAGNNSTSPLSQHPGGHAARVSADGLQAAFNSAAPLSGYDNHDQASGQADTEVYLYDAAAEGGEGKLVCASCNPSGARPVGNPGDGATPFWVAGQIPGWENQLYASRVLTANGKRLFFDSNDALVPADTDGTEDVYQWEAPGEGGCTTASPGYAPANGGCVSLISSGKSPAGSEFVEADPSGRDVFFTTLSSLVPQDPGLVDVYDAREGGGLPPPPSPPAQCEGEACQPAAQGPDDRTPASATFAGAGNVREAPSGRRPCPRGRREVKHKGKARCVAKKHKPKKAKRHRKHSHNRASADRGGAR